MTTINACKTRAFCGKDKIAFRNWPAKCREIGYDKKTSLAFEMKPTLTLNTERLKTAIWYCNSATKVSLLPDCLRTIQRNKWNYNGIEIVAEGYIKL